MLHVVTPLFPLVLQLAGVSASPLAQESYFGEQCIVGPCAAERKCSLPFNSSKMEVTRKVWDGSNAKTYLSKFLDQHGVNNWVNQLFISMLPEQQGGATFDCTNFPTDGKCDLPGFNLCKNYNPPEAFFIHMSIANMYSSFVKIHEAIQDKAIVLLASDIKDIVDDFGPGDGLNINSYIWALLIGAFVLGCPLSATLAPAMTAGVGILNLAAGGANMGDAGLTNVQLNNELESQLGKMYSTWSDTLDDTVKAVFEGRVEETPNWRNSGTKDPKKFINGLFSDGIWTDFTLVNPMTDAWIDAWKKMVKDGFIIQALNATDKYVFLENDWHKDSCEAVEGYYWIFKHSKCAYFAETYSDGFIPPSARVIADQTSIMKDKYDVDIEAFLGNAIECAKNGGGEPKFDLVPDTSKPELPACLVNLPVLHGNDMGYLESWPPKD